MDIQVSVPTLLDAAVQCLAFNSDYVHVGRQSMAGTIFDVTAVFLTDGVRKKRHS